MLLDQREWDRDDKEEADEAIEEIREAVSDWKNATRDVLLLITHATP